LFLNSHLSLLPSGNEAVENLTHVFFLLVRRRELKHVALFRFFSPSLLPPSRGCKRSKRPISFFFVPLLPLDAQLIGEDLCKAPLFSLSFSFFSPFFFPFLFSFFEWQTSRTLFPSSFFFSVKAFLLTLLAFSRLLTFFFLSEAIDILKDVSLPFSSPSNQEDRELI